MVIIMHLWPSESDHDTFPETIKSIPTAKPQFFSHSRSISPPIQEPSVPLKSQLPIWKDVVLKRAHANFIRFRKPEPERIRELVLKAVQQIGDTTSSIEGVQLYDTARKSFDNMRNEFMAETRKLAKGGRADTQV